MSNLNAGPSSHRRLYPFAFLTPLLFAACSGNSSDSMPSSTGGIASTSGGSSAQTGGALLTSSTQIFLGSGGATTMGTVNGGTTSANGGATTMGTVSGGTTSTSSSTGGTPAKGGAASTGGTSAKGGASPTGGTSAKGGTSPTGGTSAKGGTTSTNGGTTSTHTGPWKLMALGDSITNFCYPQDLSGTLTANGKTNFTFIGTQTANQGGCGTPSVASVKTEGHGGYFVTYLMTDSPPQSGKGTLTELKSWATQKPDVVLLEMGTNDVWSNISASNITNAYGFVVDQFRSQNPAVIFFVAQITPMHPSSTCCEPGVETLNAAIPAWASSKSTTASPIYVVNVWASIDQAAYVPNSTLTTDGVHPAPAAARLMANAWYAGLTARGLP